MLTWKYVIGCWKCDIPRVCGVRWRERERGSSIVFIYHIIVVLAFYSIINGWHLYFGLEALTAHISFTPDAASIASSIKYHAEFTPLFSPERFELPKAFFATAQSVRDALIINWNATYDYYEKLNVKQAYYLSMEFLQVCYVSSALIPTIYYSFLSFFCSLTFYFCRVEHC